MAPTLTVATLQTQLTTDDKNFTSGLQGATRTAGKWAANIGKTIATAGLAVVATGAAAAAAGVAGLGVAITKMTLDAAAVQGTVNTFDKLVESVGSDSVQALEMLRTSTRGMISDADLMQASNKFLAMGIATTAEEAAQLAEVSTQLGLAMGEDVTGSMENFALMMANQSIPRLDSFGISSSVVRERIKELMEETEGLTREAAFNQAVMEQAAVTMGKVGEQSDTATASMAGIRATIENVKLGIGQAFIPVLQELLSAIRPIIDDVGPRLTEWAQIAGTWLGENLPGFIEKTKIAFEDVWFALNAFISMSPGDFPWEDILPPALAEIAYEIADAFEQFIGIIESGQGVFAAIVEILDDFLPEETINRIWDFHDATIALAGNAIAAVVDFWNDELMPAFQTAEKFIKDNMVSVIGGLEGAFIGLAAALAGGAIAALISGIGTAVAAVATPVAALIALGALIGAAWAGNWGGIRDIVDETINGVILPAVETVKAWFEENWPIIQAVALTAWEVIKDIATTVADIFISDILPKFQEAFTSIGEALGTLGIDWGTLGDIVKGVLAVAAALILAFIGIVVGVVSGIAAAFNNLATVFNEWSTNFKTTIDAIVTFFTDMVAAVKAVFAGDWEGALALWNSATEAAGVAIKGIIDGIWLSIKATFGTILTFIGGFVEGVVGFFQGLWDRLTGGSIIPDMMADINSVITTALDTIAGLWETFKDNVVGFVETLKTDLDTKWNDIKTALETAWDNIKMAAETKANDVLEAITTRIDQIKTDIDTTWENIKTAVTVAWALIKAVAEQVAQEVWDAITTKIGEIKTKIDTIWLLIKSAAIVAWNNIKTEIETRVGEIVAEIISMFTTSLSKAREFIQDFIQAGIDLIDGLIEGIRLQALKLFRIVRDTIQGALDVVEDVLDIGSPSQVFIDFGISIVEGLIEGVLSRQDSWFGTISELFDMSRVFGGLATGALRLFRERRNQAIG
jgi:phage-related protein